MDSRPLVVHIIFRLDFGGLETLLAECINRMPAERYRHAVVCLTTFTEFAKAITAPGVEIHALGKPPGLAPGIHLRLWRLMRKLRPTIVHTYNLAAVEYAFTAALAGVPVRIHSEHGRDAGDPNGINPKHRFLRRMVAPFIDCQVAVSRDLQQWLRDFIGIPARKAIFIPNGVDTDRFRPDSGNDVVPPSMDMLGNGNFVIGTVGRVQDIKNHAGLIDAFLVLREALTADTASRLRLAIVGDGPLLPAIRKRVADAGLEHFVWLPGARRDISNIMRRFSVFVLPSFAEGTPVTILEAMATGLPVVASRVGGIPDVVEHGIHGTLVAPADTAALADALKQYLLQPSLARRHGDAARTAIEKKASIRSMVSGYMELYDTLCRKKGHSMEPVKSCAE